MATVQIDRTCGIDEIAAEMDRRGAIIEKLEAEIELLKLNRAFERGREDSNRALMKRRLDDLRDNQDALVSAGKHLAVKLSQVYHAAGQKPANCQAIRDWIAALAKAEGAAMTRAIECVGDIARIELTRGFAAIIDIGDLPLVTHLTWRADIIGRTVYAVSARMKQAKTTKYYLHRVIMQAPAGVLVDHVDGDGLNCRRGNLRLATRAQNAMNSRASASNRVGVKGVDFLARSGRFRATISSGGKTLHLGLFETQEEAGSAYARAAAKLFGEFSRAM